MKLLLLGKNGQLGWQLQRSLAPLGQLLMPDRMQGGDLADLAGLAQTIRLAQPDVIVNAAAYTDVDRAESEPEQAQLINAQAPGVLAQEAQHIGALLVHYSSDYVFDGSGMQPWVEASTPAPLSVYGTSKLAGEQAIHAAQCSHLIFRSSWIYAVRGHNFVRTILRLAQERDSLQVVDDQIGAPTGADLLADVTAHAICAVRRDGKAQGLYHVTASGQTSWYDYARCVLEHAQRLGMTLKIRPQDVRPMPSSSWVAAAVRPKNSQLNCDKLRSHFGLYLPPWQMGVIRMLEGAIT